MKPVGKVVSPGVQRVNKRIFHRIGFHSDTEGTDAEKQLLRQGFLLSCIDFK
jgi:hypothetical protein